MRKTTVVILVILLAMMTGCGKKTVYPESPEVATGTTDSEGIASVDVGPFTVNIKVVNTYEQPLSGMSARAYLLKDYLLAVASSPNGSYYTSLNMLSYDDAQSNARPAVPAVTAGENSTQSIAARDADITIIMRTAGLSSYGFDTAVPNLDALESDEWVTPVAQDYNMTGLYNLTDSVDYTGGTFVHLTPQVSSSIGAGRQTASFLVNRIADVPTFASLVSLQLRVFDGDTIHTKVLNFIDGKLPIIVIDDIGMNRNFLVQFTLTWGENPSDLDSHIWTPSIDGYVHHIYYGNAGIAASAPYVDLDVDDVSSYGPEHITVWQPYTGTYIYAVYHYAGTGDITTSEAQVDALRPDGTVEHFNVPSGSASSNWWWHVCTVDGETGIITPVNSISADPPTPAFMPPMPPKTSIE
ncbi:MAG: hypothetical protein V3W18_06725 [candidate division Zixibacteria bacterium]